jgi:hypothetical protein
MLMMSAQKISERVPGAAGREKCPPVAPTRAGSEIAVNNPERSKRSRWRGLTGDARERRIVFVNNVGWHVPGLLADQSKCIARLLPSRRRTLQKYYAGGSC